MFLAACSALTFTMYKGYAPQCFSETFKTTPERLLASLNACDISTLLLACVFFFFYKNFSDKTASKERIYALVPALLFSLFTVIGYSFHITDSYKFITSDITYIVRSIIRIIGYTALFRLCIVYAFGYIENTESEDNSKNKKQKPLFEKSPFFAFWIMILIGWLPYNIITYPGYPQGDTIIQLEQVFGTD